MSCMSGHLGWLYCHALFECVCLAWASVCVLHERSPWLAVLPCFARVCVSCMCGHLGWLYCLALLECVSCMSGHLGWLYCHALFECVCLA